MNKKTVQNFGCEKTVEIAKDLLGKYLVREIKGKKVELMITEVEAYDGPEDRASHASKGKTERTKIMFGHPGRFYVYLCYGMHWMLNIVTGPKDYPAAILIRGAGDMNGPAKLTKFLGVDKKFNDKPCSMESGLWVEDRGVIVLPRQIHKGPRIGVAYAGPVWAKKHYRFWLSPETVLRLKKRNG